MRVVSLLPAATEIVAALGQLDALVGIVDSLEIMAEILHPELFAGRFPGRAFQRVPAA